uniref:Uncharacterized protein n=1 Tax=Vitis vinifera TaxID=29760 RepID=F6HJN0_VITVI
MGRSNDETNKHMHTYTLVVWATRSKQWGLLSRFYLCSFPF